MIGAVGAANRPDVPAVTDPVPEDQPGLFGPRVKASGVTSAGLRVDLVTYDHERAVDEESEYDSWPTDEPNGPPPAALGRLLVEVTDRDGVTGVAGAVSWHRVAYGATSGSHAWNIGIGLAPASRGHGVGWLAQQLLAVWLLERTSAYRIEASTDVVNVAEQRALERAGFTREGLLRSAQARADGRHDLYSYSLLRSDLEP
jgi:RimJ/RimL family protein N-acetyltransferase